jgi:hypothetical protein
MVDEVGFLARRGTSATSWLRYPRWRYAANCGIAIAARMPMIATTTSSSISVKPLLLLCLALVIFRMCPP